MVGLRLLWGVYKAMSLDGSPEPSRFKAGFREALQNINPEARQELKNLSELTRLQTNSRDATAKKGTPGEATQRTSLHKPPHISRSSAEPCCFIFGKLNLQAQKKAFGTAAPQWQNTLPEEVCIKQVQVEAAVNSKPSAPFLPPRSVS